MHIHINHCFCLDSNWGGTYHCRYMVIIPYSLKDPYPKPHEDWGLLKEHKFFDQKRYEDLKELFKEYDDKLQRTMSTRRTMRLSPEVYQWLEKNVANVKGEKGFCVGTDQYNTNALTSFTIFFQRRSDALKFIKTWSIYKKPTIYFDYFKGIRKELNLKTNKLETVEEFTLF